MTARTGSDGVYERNRRAHWHAPDDVFRGPVYYFRVGQADCRSQILARELFHTFGVRSMI